MHWNPKFLSDAAERYERYESRNDTENVSLILAYKSLLYLCVLINGVFIKNGAGLFRPEDCLFAEQFLD